MTKAIVQELTLQEMKDIFRSNYEEMYEMYLEDGPVPLLTEGRKEEVLV